MLQSQSSTLFVCLVWLYVSGWRISDAFQNHHHLSSFVHRPPRSRTSLFGSVEDEPAVRLANLVRPSVALVVPKGVRNMTTRGSGFVIDRAFDSKTNSTYIVTAAHVAVPGFGVDVVLGGQTLGATVVARNTTLDLALLRTKEIKAAKGLDVVSDFPDVGTRAYALGHPASNLQNGPAMTSGIVCGIANGFSIPETDAKDASSTTTYIVTDAGMSFGMSGGPLVDRTGNVLGVNALVRPDLRALGNYAVSNRELKGFLESIERSETADIASPTQNAYRVVLFNDPMNKKERVSSVLQSVAGFDEQQANRVMMEAHKTGRGIVQYDLEQDLADTLCLELRQQDVLVEVERA